MDTKCISCNRSVRNDPQAISFPCPSCGKGTIVRCGNCRKTAVPYECECGFGGP